MSIKNLLFATVVCVLPISASAFAADMSAGRDTSLRLPQGAGDKSGFVGFDLNRSNGGALKLEQNSRSDAEEEFLRGGARLREREMDDDEFNRSVSGLDARGGLSGEPIYLEAAEAARMTGPETGFRSDFGAEGEADSGDGQNRARSGNAWSGLTSDY
jgi:hypothetical protein